MPHTVRVDEGRAATVTRREVLLSAIALGSVTLALAGCGSGANSTTSRTTPTTPTRPARRPVSGPHFRFFSPSGFWNAPLPANAPLDPSSAAVIGALNLEVDLEQSKHELNINTLAWSVPIYTVPASQPLVKVTLNKPNSQRNPLQAAWDAVPLPPNAQPARGTDKHLVVWQPSTDKLWEFWAFEQTPSGPVAKWGGAMRNVSKNPGAYDTSAWPGAQPEWGASGSSLSIAGGLITFEDIEHGFINHALMIAVPRVRAGVYASPAQRTDGVSSSPLALPEGAHLRLDPNLDLSALHLPPLTLMLAEAAQRYGILVMDGGGNIAFDAQDPAPIAANPYTGPAGYFEGKGPYTLLASFPWSHLQLLKMELHRGR
jgi:hypothetical protein